MVIKLKKRKFYITTPLFYVNDVPHIGHAYTTIAADVLARFKRLEGFDVYFLTGTDEHGQKIAQAAAEAGKENKQFVDDIVWSFINAWKLLNISNNDFIRTTEERHERVVTEIIKKIYENGDIYKGEYEGWYCIPDESFWTELQLKDGKCPECGRDVKKIKEESYFFRLSKYQRKLLNFYKKNPNFISPKHRKQEIINRVKEGLKDLSITRTVKWGVPFPIDDRFTIWVWIDALINYISALGYPDKKFKKFWPADVHVIGKEINWFHTVIWPALLFSAGIKPPKKVFVHGWWTVEGKKISKSIGNVIDPIDVINKYGIDELRYFLLREVPFGSDGDYSERALIARINSDLANDLGNLVNRALVMTEKYFNGFVPLPYTNKKIDLDLISFALSTSKKVCKAIEKLQFSDALNEIWALAAKANKYINETEPWRIKNEKRLGTIIYNLLESLRFIAILISPFMPLTSKKIAGYLGLEFSFSFKDLKWGKIKQGTKIKREEILFKKIELKEVGKMITIEEFQKLDLRIGQIKSAEDVPESDKLVKLKVDIAGEERQLVAGLRPQYTSQELVGKQIVVLTNLKPVKIRGIESQGMLLAALEDGKPILIAPNKAVKPGSRIE